MAVAKLVMQEWKDMFDKILESSDIKEYLSGLYVDDGRTYQRKHKFNYEQNKFAIDVDSEKLLGKLLGKISLEEK